MHKSDRIFGLVTVLVALAYIASATQIQTNFLADSVGRKAFPMMVGAIAALCGAVMVLRPNAQPDWPELHTFGALFATIGLMILAPMLSRVVYSSGPGRIFRPQTIGLFDPWRHCFQ